MIARTYHFLDALINPAPAPPPATPHGYPLHEGVCVPNARAARARARACVRVCPRRRVSGRVKVAYGFRWHIVLLVYYKRACDTLSCSC